MVPAQELLVFAAVVEAGSLSAAARRLGLSKAAVSDRLRRLEAALGARLLHRTTRRLSLTAAGEACHAHSQRMAAEAEAAMRAAGALHAEPRGTLRVAAPTTFAPLHIVPALPAFRARYQQVSVELSVATHAIDLVAEGFDLAIRIGRLPDSRLVARRLAVQRLVVCGAPGYLERRGAPATPGGLERHDALEFTPLGWRAAWHMTGPDGGSRRVAIRPALRSDAGEALLAAAIGGMGLAFLPNWMVAPALAAGALVQVLPAWSSRPVPIQAVHAGGRELAARTRLFLDHLALHLARAGWRQ
ncbi:MAG: LysR family transcriptional regulator [Alphaproteobacteria bacterium]|nr:LysR family transcriptional regulator [Alphaproteobacteria bacterium]